MSLAAALLVGVGGALGAVARHLVGLRVAGRRSIVLVNVLGSLGLGALLALPATAELALFVGVGFCGAFTTFSAFALETVTTAEGGEPVLAIRFALVNLLGSILALLAASAMVSGALQGAPF